MEQGNKVTNKEKEYWSGVRIILQHALAYKWDRDSIRMALESHRFAVDMKFAKQKDRR